jgi:hypothetical protein
MPNQPPNTTGTEPVGAHGEGGAGAVGEIEVKKAIKGVPKGLLLVLIVFTFVYSMLGVVGLTTEGPMFAWSALWYPRDLVPGTTHHFQDHLLNVFLFGGWCSIWAWRVRRHKMGAEQR